MEQKNKSGKPSFLSAFVLTALSMLLSSVHLLDIENKKAKLEKIKLIIPKLNKVVPTQALESLDVKSIKDSIFMSENYEQIGAGDANVTSYYIPVYSARYFSKNDSLPADLVPISVPSNVDTVKIYVTKAVVKSIKNESLVRLTVTVDGIYYDNIWVNQKMELTASSSAYLGPSGLPIVQYTGPNKVCTVAACADYKFGDIVVFTYTDESGSQQQIIAIVTDRGRAVSEPNHFDMFTGDHQDDELIKMLEIGKAKFTVYRKKPDTFTLLPGSSTDSIQKQLDVGSGADSIEVSKQDTISNKID